jgi:hypothetical protein
MKKKLMIIGAMIFVCTGLFLLAQKGQNSYINNKVSTTIPVESKAAEIASNNEVQPSAKVGSVSEQNKTNTAAATGSTAKASEVKPNSTESKAVTKAPEVPKATPTPSPAAATPPVQVPAEPKVKGNFNFAILDEVNNKVIIDKNVDFDNVTVDYITCKILKDAGIKYINEGEGSSTSYFNSIAGLTERKAGPLSGWCFYINGQKPGLGAGGYSYHKGDVVQWKYSKDALNN